MIITDLLKSKVLRPLVLVAAVYCGGDSEPDCRNDSECAPEVGRYCIDGICQEREGEAEAESEGENNEPWYEGMCEDLRDFYLHGEHGKNWEEWDEQDVIEIFYQPCLEGCGPNASNTELNMEYWQKWNESGIYTDRNLCSFFFCRFQTYDSNTFYESYCKDIPFLECLDDFGYEFLGKC